MEYRPLDLSFLSNYANQPNSTQNIAQQILAQGGRSKSYAEIAQTNAATHTPATPWYQSPQMNRVWDLLNIGTYTVANSAYKAIDEHQKSNDNSVLSDIGNTLKGVGVGAVEGLGASLRGTFDGLIPGLGTDDGAASQDNKRHFGDVLSKWYLGMDAAQANDPANKAKVIDKLKTAKTSYLNMPGEDPKHNLMYPGGVGDPQYKQFLKEIGIAGIGADVISDPLNLVNPLGIASKIREGMTLSKGAAELPDVAKAAKAANGGMDKLDNVDRYLATAPHSAIPNGTSDIFPGVSKYANTSTSYLASKLTPKFKTPELADGSYRVIPSGGEPINNLTKAGARIEYPKGWKAKQEPRPPEGYKIDTGAQKDIANRVLKQISVGEKNWLYKAADQIRGRSGGQDMPHTTAFLENLSQMAKKSGKSIKTYATNPGVHAELKNAIKTDAAKLQHIGSDAERARYFQEVMRAQSLVNDPHTADIIVKQFKAPPPKLKGKGQQIFIDTVRKYSSKVLGSDAPTIERKAGAITAAQKRGDVTKWSGPTQVNTYQTILKGLPYANSSKYQHATDILKRVESYFEARNAVPHSTYKASESIPLKLSRVLEAIGPEAANMNRSLLTNILKGDPEALAGLSAEQLQKLEIAKAGEALAAAPGVKAGIDSGNVALDEMSKMALSDPRKLDAWKSVIENAKSTAKLAGAGESGAWIAGKHFENVLGTGSPISNVFRSERFNAEAFLAHAAKNDARFTKVDPKTLTKLDRAMAKAADMPIPVQLATNLGKFAKSVEWLGLRLNAAYGNADMRPLFLEHMASAFSTAAVRSKFMSDLRKQFGGDPEVWNAAWKSAQGNLPPVGGPVDDLAKELQTTLENLFGGSGLKEGAIAEATVAGRSRLFMSDLNRNMKRFGLAGFEFTAKSKVKGADGIVRDLSKNADWLKSWETWEIKDPYKFMHQIQSVVETTVREKALYDEIISRFGAFKRLPGGVKYGVNHPRFKGVYFTEEGARQVTKMLSDMKEMAKPTSKTLQHVQHVIGKFKAGVTIYWPSHHINNLIGDVSVNWYAGVNSPGAYTLAMKAMKAQTANGKYFDLFVPGRDRIQDVSQIAGMMGPDALKQAMARGVIGNDAMNAAGLETHALGNSTLFKMRNGERVTPDMLSAAMQRRGILPVGRILEELESSSNALGGGLLNRIRQPFGGKVQSGAHQISETRDHWPRYAQFIDHLMKSNKSFADSIEEGANLVRKWHPDGLDLTKFEKNTIKTILPFYSWMRKAVPLMIETAMTAPAKIKAYPQLMQAIQQANGIQSQNGFNDPFPTDQLFTDWMRQKGIGPIMGSAGNYTIINPSVPGTDVLSAITDPRTTIEGYVSPLIKVPLEGLQGREIATGATIGQPGGQSWWDWAAKQTPIVSNIGRASGQFGVSNSVKTQGSPNYQNIINMMTGLRMTNTGQYQKSAQFDLRDYLKRKYAP